ncbi:MAG: HAD family hydrolase [Candidatus Izemoplasmatales bacterium]|jgi:HAD superfamily hydrolase (TIGR01509 family)|nr:HAD family hydrolase [Candidatus Izemoplasmatales bacterium]
MSKFQAIFFDRDGTLTRNNMEMEKELHRRYKVLSGVELNLPYERFIKFFMTVLEQDKPYIPYKTIEDEIFFFIDFYELLLIDDGVIEDVKSKAKYIGDKLWYIYKEPFDEVKEVLEYFKNKGYILGVISDGPPSLEYSLELIGLSKYFTSFTSSSVVGVGKPDPRIFQYALDLARVNAEDCIYVDDTLDEANGARDIGMTSFHIDRNNKYDKTKWTISNLKQIIEYVELNQNNC